MEQAPIDAWLRAGPTDAWRRGRMTRALVMAGALLLAFGWWGLETTAGRHRFDEMAGMIPLAVGALGALLLTAGVILGMIRAQRRGG